MTWLNEFPGVGWYNLQDKQKCTLILFAVLQKRPEENSLKTKNE
jgi:hypothetical protein